MIEISEDYKIKWLWLKFLTFKHVRELVLKNKLSDFQFV